jgi:DNA gyrase subunit A
MAKGVEVAGALGIGDQDEIMLFTSSGQAVRSPVKEIRVIGRATQGVRLIHLAKGDELIALNRIEDVDGEEVT